MTEYKDIDIIEGFQFDALKIRTEIEAAAVAAGLSTMDNQLNIFHREGTIEARQQFLAFNGSLHPDKNRTGILVHESEFNIIHPLLKGSYTEEVCAIIKQRAIDDGVKLGRVRLLGINPKSCYSWHTDPDNVRYHIPLKTFVEAFFVVDEGVYRMPDEGKLYTIASAKWHTAVNAAFNKRRVHLVFDTYTSDTENPYETTLEDAATRFDTNNIY